LSVLEARTLDTALRAGVDATLEGALLADLAAGAPSGAGLLAAWGANPNGADLLIGTAAQLAAVIGDAAPTRPADLGLTVIVSPQAPAALLVARRGVVAPVTAMQEGRQEDLDNLAEYIATWRYGTAGLTLPDAVVTVTTA
jgi:hypothetical protein